MGADRRVARIIESRSPSLANIPATDENPGLRGHAVVIGSGRVGRLIIGALARRGFPFVVVATPDAHVARLIIQHARRVNPRAALVVRTHDERHLAEVASLEGHAQAIHGELELGVQTTRYTLRRFGISTIEAEAIAEGLRGRGGRPWPLDPM
jgi:monovalent cation:H+ antiporter-2, CPA2 family